MKLINQLMPINQQDIEDVRNIYNKTEDDVKKDVEILKAWMAKQPHLPQNYDEDRLERILMRNKFRIEQCKSKIDSYFTLRGMYPDFFENTNPTLEGFNIIRKALIYVPMPQLTAKKERIVITSFNAENVDLFDIKQHFEYILAVMDLEFSHDYAAATRFVMDFKNLSMAHVKALELTNVIKGFTLYQDAYSARISGIDWFNAPKYIDLLVAILKIAMKPKLFNKIKVHKTMDELYENINKQYLPSDYGGEQESMQEIHDRMGDMWKEEINFLSQNVKLVSNEKLRVGKPYKNENFGADGTFKKLNLD